MYCLLTSAGGSAGEMTEAMSSDGQWERLLEALTVAVPISSEKRSYGQIYAL